MYHKNYREKQYFSRKKEKMREYQKNYREKRKINKNL